MGKGNSIYTYRTKNIGGNMEKEKAELIANKLSLELQRTLMMEFAVVYGISPERIKEITDFVRDLYIDWKTKGEEKAPVVKEEPPSERAATISESMQWFGWKNLQ